MVTSVIVDGLVALSSSVKKIYAVNAGFISVDNPLARQIMYH